MRIAVHLSIVSSVVLLGTLAVSAQTDEILPVTGRPSPDTPQYHFQIACLSCQNGNQGIAARQMRNALKLLKQEATRATANGKTALNRSIHELEHLADAMERGKASSIEDVKAAFARAQYALAYHHQQRASESLLRRNFKQAGEDLKAASYDIEYGLAWTGEGVEMKSRDVIVATRNLGNTLIGGAKIDVQHIDAQARMLGSELRRFGGQIVRPVQR